MPAWDPFTAEIPKEVPLANAPLVRVIAQVRFPTVVSILRPEALATFQEAVRHRYPVLREERSQGIAFGLGGAQSLEPQLIWRFSGSAAPKASDDWTLALTKDFISIEAGTYTSRRDFLERLEEALAALQAAFHPASMDRLGIRYVDRIQGEIVNDLQKYVSREMLGVLGSPLRAHANEHALSDFGFSLKEGSLRARWGLMPPKMTYDPGAFEPVDETSWVLDLDAFTRTQSEFDTRQIVDRARYFTERIYAFFRWSVTDDFLRAYGGNP